MNKSLSIIIPCYNEKNTIEKIINKIHNIDISKQIILVDDNSNDGTSEIIKDYLNDKVDIVIYHTSNMGKGACIKSAKTKIKNDIIIIQDADLEYDPNDYEKLIQPIIEKKTKIVYGSRVLNKTNFNNKNNFISSFRIFGNYLLTRISNIINSQKLTDAHTCYKVFSKDVFDQINLEEKGFNFCPEITTKVSNIGEKILEVPISYNGRSEQDGKKIRLWHAFEAVYTLIKYKFLKNDN